MAHIGQNIAKLRGLKRWTQKEAADKLKLTQPEYSRIEQKPEIDDNLLQMIADVFEVSPEAIKRLDENTIINNIENTFNDNATQNFNDATQYLNTHATQNQLNPTEKIVELYERLLKEKDATITLLKNKLDSQADK